MTFYDLRVFDDGNQRVHLTGSNALVRALRHLESASQQGRLPAEVVVELWADIPVPGEVLRELLAELRQDAGWVVDGRMYTVALDEF